MSRASIPYFQKLKDPRWQRKRLEVLQSHDFTCQMCGDAETTLHVHHKQYIKGRDPWEYDAEQLVTVCETCHFEGHDREDFLTVAGSYLPLDGPYSRDSIASLISCYADLKMTAPEDGLDHASGMVGILARRLFGFGQERLLEKLIIASNSQQDADAMLQLLLDFAASKQ